MPEGGFIWCTHTYNLTYCCVVCARPQELHADAVEPAPLAPTDVDEQGPSGNVAGPAGLVPPAAVVAINQGPGGNTRRHRDTDEDEEERPRTRSRQEQQSPQQQQQQQQITHAAGAGVARLLVQRTAGGPADQLQQHARPSRAAAQAARAAISAQAQAEAQPHALFVAQLAADGDQSPARPARTQADGTVADAQLARDDGPTHAQVSHVCQLVVVLQAL